MNDSTVCCQNPSVPEPQRECRPNGRRRDCLSPRLGHTPALMLPRSIIHYRRAVRFAHYPLHKGGFHSPARLNCAKTALIPTPASRRKRAGEFRIAGEGLLFPSCPTARFGAGHDRTILSGEARRGKVSLRSFPVPEPQRESKPSLHRPPRAAARRDFFVIFMKIYV